MNLPPAGFPFWLVLTISLGSGVCLAVCVSRILSRESAPKVNSDWPLLTNTERYRPMLRLLSDADVAFLRAQPGFRPSMAAKLRTQRCEILRAYLKALNLDFRSMCAAIRVLRVHSHQDRTGSAWALFRHRLSFGVRMLMVQVEIVLYGLGLGKVDVTGLVALFDLTQRQLRRLAPATMPASL